MKRKKKKYMMFSLAVLLFSASLFLLSCNKNQDNKPTVSEKSHCLIKRFLLNMKVLEK